MEIANSQLTDPHNVRITSHAGGGAITLDGVDISRIVHGYSLHQAAGQPAQLVVQFAPGRPATEYDGLAQVAVGIPHEPGEAAERFLAAIDIPLLEQAAMHRLDLAGGQHGFTAAIVEQLRQWARGEEEGEPDAFRV